MVSPALQATFRFPRGIEFAPDGSFYIADHNHYMIRRIDQAGLVSTVAGHRAFVFEYAGEGVPALEASFGGPSDVVVDANGNIYVANAIEKRVRRITTDGIIRTLAGTGVTGRTGDGGPAELAQLDGSTHLALHPEYGLLIGGGGPVRRVDLATGIIYTVPDSWGSSIAVDAAGRLYYLRGNSLIWRHLGTGETAVVTSALDIRNPGGLAVDAQGNIYVADFEFHRVWKVSPDGSISLFAGGGDDDATLPALAASIADSNGLAFDAHGNLFFTDFGGHRIRRVDRNGYVETVAGTGSARGSDDLTGGDGGHPLQARMIAPQVLIFDRHGNLLFIDAVEGVGVVRLITPGADGVIDGSADERITTVAGHLRPRTEADRGAADGCAATQAVFVGARGIALDAVGNLYVADWMDHRIRVVLPGSDGVLNGQPDELIYTVVGNGIEASAGDGGLANRASVREPNKIAFGPDGDLYINEPTGRAIRRVDAETGVITTWATDVAASSFLLDPYGNFFSTSGRQILRIDASTGSRDVIAGTGEPGYNGDGIDAREALFRGASFLALDQEGNLYSIDNGNFLLRKVTFVPLSGELATAPAPLRITEPAIVSLAAAGVTCGLGGNSE